MAALSPETQRPLDALPSTLYDFFAEELYGSTALKLQRQLCLFAAARTSNPLAAELAFKPEDLTDAAHAGFLTISRDRIDLHPLLADFLGDKAATAQTLRDDLESFARLLISKSLWDEAFSVFAHLKDSDLLLDLFETAIQPMLAEGRLVALESWISSARDYHVGGPLVDRAEAELAYRQGNYRIGETLALRAAQKASDSDVAARSYLVAARCAHLLGRGKEANEYYLRLQSLSDDDSLVRTGLWGKFVVSLELNPVEAAATLERLRSLPVRDSTDLVQVLGGALDLGRRFSGLSEATLESEVGEALLDDVRDPLVKTHFLNARAGALVALGVYDEATTTAKKELAEALAYRLRFVLPHAFIHLSNALLGLRRFAEAEDASKKASNAARKARDRYSEFNAIAVQARLLIARAQYQEAVGLLDVDLTNVPMAALREECRATRALALAAGGRLDESISLCESPREVFDLQAELLRAFAKAIVSMQLDKSSGDSDAQSAFEASAKSGYFDSCVLAYRAFPPLLTHLVGIESIVNRLRPLLEAAHDFELARFAGLDISLDSGSPLSGLSRREMEVLNLLVEGLTNREIAQRLFIQESTAKVHVRHILAKLSVRTRTEAALLGSRYGA